MITVSPSPPSSLSNEDTVIFEGLYNKGPIPFKIARLSSVQRKLLNEASAKAQTLRRELANGAHVLIIQGGYFAKRFIYERIKELGCTITMLERADSPLRVLVDEGIIDNFIEFDFGDSDTMFERAMSTIARAHPGTYFDAVTTYYESGVFLAVQIAEALGCQLSPVSAYGNARNKRRTREVMSAAGLPVPRFARITCADDVAKACKTVGFPAIMKPTYGAASIGVCRVEGAQEAHDTYTRIVDVIEAEDQDIITEGTELVMEEFYDGDEFDVDIVLSEGKVVYSNVLDNWACPPPHFQESGRNAPSLYPTNRQSEMISLASRTVLALGFRAGVLHVEMKFTSRGARIIEVNSRMGGNSVREIHLRVFGVDLAEEHAFCALGIPSRPFVADRPLMYLADYMINAPYTGTVNSDDWLEFARANPQLHRIEYSMEKGEHAQGPEDGLPDRIASVIVSSSSSGKQACELVRDMVIKQTVPITPHARSVARGFIFCENKYPFIDS